MKVGDTVKLNGSHAEVMGIIVSSWKIDGWWEIFTTHNQVIHWPDSQMEVVKSV